MCKKLSVIMPVYNVKKYVKNAVLSVLNQTYKNVELVLIDDGSTDGSSEICKKLAKSDSRIRLICKKNQGVSTARNEGLLAATGDYITFVDSDDWVEIDAYEKMMDDLQKTNADICVMGYTSEGDEKFVSPLCKEDKRVLSQGEAVIKLVEGRVYTWSLWDKIYRKELLKEMYFHNDIHNGEDLLFNWQVFGKATAVSYFPLYGYHYVQRMSSVTNTFSAKKVSVIKVFEFILEDCQNNLIIKKYIERKYIATLIGLINGYWLDYEVIRFGYDISELNDAKKYLQNNWMNVLRSSLSKRIKICAFLIMLPTPITSLAIISYYFLKRRLHC